MSAGIISVLSRKEAFVKGVVLERPDKHQILHVIEERTTIKNAKSSVLMEYESLVEELSDKFTETNIRKTLIELKLDNLVIVFPGITYNEDSRQLEPRLFITAKPEKKNYDVIDVYHEVVNASVAAAVSYVVKGYTFNRDEFWKDLESSMLESSDSEIFYPNIYFSIDILFEYPGLVLRAEKNIFDQFKNDLKKGIVEARKAVWLSNHRIFLISDQYINDLAQTLKSFFYTRVMSQVENIPVVSREADVIRLQEEIFALESDNRQTMSFVVAKTYPIVKYFTEEKYPNEKSYPGRIVIVLIQELEKYINEAYEKNHIAHIYKKYEELKNLICTRESGQNPLFIFTEDDLKNIPPESIEKVKNERNIVHTRWESPSGTVQLFLEMSQDNFSEALSGLNEIPERHFWKILAFRKLLQNSTKITSEKNPFVDKNFFKAYGELLNHAYVRILPFYYNILLFFEVGFIRNLVYKSIKNYIEVQQNDLQRKNKLKREEQKRGLIEKLSEKKASLNKFILRNRILEELDFFYFKQNLIPNIKEIKERFPEIRSQVFVQILEEFSFTVIKTDPADKWEQNILFYPHNNTWLYNIERTREKMKALRKLEENLSKSNSDDRPLSKRIRYIDNALNLS